MLQPRIYKRCHIKTGRKDRGPKRASSAPRGGSWDSHKLKFQRDISAAKVPPEEHRVSISHQVPQPRAPESGRGAHISSGCESQQGFCWPGRKLQRYRQLLKRPPQNLICSYSPCMPIEGGQSRFEFWEERMGFVVQGTVTGDPVLSQSPKPQMPAFLDGACLHVASARGNAIALPSGLLVAPTQQRL